MADLNVKHVVNLPVYAAPGRQPLVIEQLAVILILSILLRIIALVWSVALQWRVKDWRMGFLTAMLALMALRQVLTLRKVSAREDWNPYMDWSSVELPGLAVSVLAGLFVIFLQRLIKDRRRINDELRARDTQALQTQKMEALGQLAGRTAHDFNNILTVIIGNAELARMQLPEGHQALENIIELEKASQRGAELSSQILSFSRKQMVEKSVFDINEVIVELSVMFRQLLGSDVEYVTLPMAAKAMLKADRSQVEQVLLNLAVNARDAMPAGGTLTVATDLDSTGSEPLITVTFQDTGYGMTKQDQDRAFEPFYTTKPIGKGTGLGLATCLGNVERNGGSISIQDSSSSGTTFLLAFPQATETEAVPRPPLKPRRDAGGSERVLVVEDEEQLRSLQVQALRALGYEVFEAPDGAEALCLMDSSNSAVDLLVTDIVMPVMGGQELARRVRAQNTRLPILFISGFVQTIESDETMNDELSGFLQKPFTSSVFTRRVRALLDRTIACSVEPSRAGESSPSTGHTGS